MKKRIFRAFGLCLCVFSFNAFADIALPDFSDFLAQEIPKQFEEYRNIISNPPDVCRDIPSTKKYLTALKVMGDFNECVFFAKRCYEENEPGTLGLDSILTEGAQCYSYLNKFSSAYKFYNLATSSKYKNSGAFVGNVYAFASFAHFSQYQNKTRAILKRNTNWNAGDISLIVAVLEYLNKGKIKKELESNAKSFIAGVMNGSDLYFKRVLAKDWFSHLVMNEYKRKEGLQFLNDYFYIFDSPRDWFFVAYSAFYRLSENNDFSLARTIYNSYIPFADPLYSLPVESNTYNYTELYTQVCPTNLLSGEAYDSYKKIRSDWETGTITSEQALNAAFTLNEQNPKKADLLTFMGGLYEMQEMDAVAQKYFFDAHKACPYYNRAHWGLKSINVRAEHAGYDDYSDLLESIDKELEGIVFPQELKSYVINWRSLSENVRKRLKYSLRFWANYIDELYKKDRELYVKFGFQLLSETPTWGGMRDKRVSYPNDYRLWDDVRGIGGSPVVADIGEMKEAAFGSYNLAGHEVAHQFHYALPKNLQDCIAKLFKQANERDVFPDPYAKTNDTEYFAQGVTYYMVSEDSPARFGINRKWIVENDVDLYNFLVSIANARDMADIRCSVALTDGDRKLGEVKLWPKIIIPRLFELDF